MCGIYACFHHGSQPDEYKYQKISPRGPDETNILDEAEYKLVFYRLAIMGVKSGSQPFQLDKVQLICNGEIYNYRELERKYNFNNKTGSDCEVILHMYYLFGIERTLNEIRGEFAFILVDNNIKVVHFARDPIGVKPLYINSLVDKKTGHHEMMELSSLIKGFSNELGKCEHVLPGYLYTYDINKHILSHQKYIELKYMPNPFITKNHIYEKLERAVLKRIIQSERPLGFFLSGGIDSCTILSIAMKSGLLQEAPHVFTFGFDKNAHDVKMAKIMVDWLKNKYGEKCLKWHLVIEPVENGLAILPEVINMLETYDTTTIRASTPMYMLSKYIRDNTNVKVLLSGEGSDELFGGYLYNLYAPNEHAFRSEIISSLNNLYIYDVLRADHSTAECGLEVRPPFLDIDLINTVLSCDLLRMSKTTTKKLLRDTINIFNILPEEILNSRKEAFSDAVGLNWLDEVKKYSYNQMIKYNDVTNDESPHIKPKGVTEWYFQKLFSESFTNKWHLLPSIWLPNQLWVNTDGESSARVLPAYNL